MTDPILPRSAISVCIGELQPHFPGVKISSRAPKTWPRTWIRASRIGGSKDWAIDRAFMLVECWAQTAAGGRDDITAEQMALLAYTVLERPLTATYWEGGAIVPLDDPDQPNWSRYQFTGTLGIGIS